MHLTQNKLKNYTGNYDTFVRTRSELLENQMKQYKWEQDQMAHMKVNNLAFCYLLFFLTIVRSFRTTLPVLVMVAQNLLAKPKVRRRL